MIYQRNADGGVINPPVIQTYEQQIHDAAQRCDFAAILRLTADYNAERDRIVRFEEGGDSKGLGWSDDDMRGGVGEDATVQDIRPRFPDGPPQMPAGMDDAMLAEQQQLRGEVRELRMLLSQLAAQGQVPGVQQDAPTPTVDAAKPTGGTTVSAGPMDAPTPTVAAAAPTGLMPGQGDIPTAPVTPATSATDATGAGNGEGERA
jgi:hypothetical protein